VDWALLPESATSYAVVSGAKTQGEDTEGTGAVCSNDAPLNAVSIQRLGPVSAA
jgi:hypothetical protein